MKTKKTNSRLKERNDVENFDFNSIYRKHSTQIMKFMMGRLKNKCDAQDALQVMWLKVEKLLCLFDSTKASLLTWLLSIAANEVNMMVGSSEYKNRKLEGDLLDSHVAEHLRYAQLPGDNHIDIQVILCGLPEQDRKIVQLYYLEGYTQREIAEKLDISLPVVNRRISKAIDKIREMLSADINEYQKEYIN